MQTPKYNPVIECMPGFQIMEEYDAWDMLSGIFGHYDLNRLRKEFWDMYKCAMLGKEESGKKARRKHLTILYNKMNDLATAAYVVFERKDFTLYHKVDAPAAFFPAWTRFKSDPWDVLLKVFTDYTLDELRSVLWTMYQAAILYTGNYHSREDRYELIFLFERLNDLATAAYVVAHEKFKSLPKEEAKK